VARHIKDVGGIRTQFHHVIDIVPTILELTGIRAPEVVNGIKQKPIEGVSMAYTFDPANANAPSKRDTQYFELGGNRAIYHDDWIAATTPSAPTWVMGTAKMPDVVNSYQWELYNIAEDYSEYNDLAAKQPEKLKELTFDVGLDTRTPVDDSYNVPFRPFATWHEDHTGSR
jgi:arylsulfatase A-like enzyme